jgi:predicted ArsR family transcriptional regulator
MLEAIFGNKTTEKVLLSLFHYNEIHVSGIARAFKTAENPIRQQLERLEQSGVIHSKLAGRTRLYAFNPKSPYSKPVKNLIELLYRSIPLQERQEIFRERGRPRRKGKPVL